MTTVYDTRAADLQATTAGGERQAVQDYERPRVRQAIVHGPEDLILMVSYLSSANEQLWKIRVSLGIIAFLLLMIVIKGWL